MKKLSIVSYNILAPQFAYSSRFPYVNSAFLEWNTRRQRILSQLCRLNCDVFCLQEVESSTYREDFGDFMEKNGYSSLCQSLKKDKYGEATKYTVINVILYKTSKFRLVDEDHRSRAVLAVLAMNSEEEKGGKSLFYLANLHLSGAPHLVAQRFNQVKSVLKAITKLRNRHKTSLEEAKVLICGDFNCDEKSSIHRFLLKGELSAGFKEEKYDEIVVKSDTTHPYGLRPTWLSENGGASSGTYITDKCNLMLDFIWYSAENMRKLSGIETVSAKEYAELCEKYLPSEDFPSDHIPIGVLLQFE